MTYHAVIGANTCDKGMAIADYQLSHDDFSQIADLLLNETGIYLSNGKMELVHSRLVKRLNILQMKNFSEYCSFIKSDAGEYERSKMLNALTTNVTRFFREAHHFEILKARILPKLIAHAMSGGQVRIWSAACSSGEEAYSIALSILDLLPNAAAYDIRILASDIDGDVLEKARKGRYSQEDIEPISESHRRKYFEKEDAEGANWRVREELRQLVCFKQFNLIKPWPLAVKFDIIFCRNVVIYFQPSTQNELWARFHRAMSPQGWLFIGHSEHVTGPASTAFQCDGSTTYRRVESTAKLFL